MPTNQNPVLRGQSYGGSRVELVGSPMTTKGLSWRRGTVEEARMLSGAAARAIARPIRVDVPEPPPRPHTAGSYSRDHYNSDWRWCYRSD
jgi:hypothetical protein